MSSIFLSHSSQDSAIAQEVKARLEQWGHRSVFLDFDPQHGIPAGRDWERELYAKLREYRAMIVLCSRASIASRWCFAEITHAKALGKPVFLIKVDDTQVDRVLTSVQAIDATAGWDEAYQRLEKGLLAAGLDPKGIFDWDGTRPPYPGLPAFQEEAAAIFFGRDKEIREGRALLNRLQQFGGPRLTLMLGASGSGKSSLMRAGLLPRLKRDQRWVVVEPFRPLKDPFDELAMVLSKRSGPSSHVRDRIRWDEQDPKQSVDAFFELIRELRKKAGSQEATVLLMIDQCEELLATDGYEVGSQFLAFLRAVLDCEDSCFVVLATLRSDFLGSFQEHPAMRGLRVEPLAVPQMQVDDFASVIEGPAKIAGLELGPGLVQAMITDTKASDALPLLAFTLRQLYEGFGEDKLLTLEEYRDKLGRLGGCIARAAEAVLSAKPPLEKELSYLRIAFLAMVRMNDREQYAKQPVLWNDLSIVIYEVMEHFVSARLLISGEGEAGRTLEVAHEAIFRAWPRLVTWIDEDCEELFCLRRAELDSEEWERQGYDYKFLWHVDQLKRLREIVARRGHNSVKKIVRLFMAPEDKIGAHLWDSSLSHQERLAIGQSLAKLGDRRRGVGLNEDGLPDIEWIDIPPGNVTKYYFWPAAINSFCISKYLVTNMQFTTFLKADDGFRNRERWLNYIEAIYKPINRAFGMESTTKFTERLILTKSWPEANYPRVLVSWYEAVLFCRWLSAKMGTSIRLPTKWEWQLAATGGNPENEFPWEGGWDASRCNSRESGLYQTTAVGMYPLGASQHGVMDIAGNVGEWCQTGNLLLRVVQGGSWYHHPGYLCASNGISFSPASWYSIIGFRLVQDIS